MDHAPGGVGGLRSSHVSHVAGCCHPPPHVIESVGGLDVAEAPCSGGHCRSCATRRRAHAVLLSQKPILPGNIVAQPPPRAVRTAAKTKKSRERTPSNEKAALLRSKTTVQQRRHPRVRE